ncbi:hypothetical protein cyc_08511 [Cyclospora cayetanensis]|uniref:RAP domain-containing protein n=1 Tax=Cyclospora cayetanensis TaxID=88456 RepID=A0A1D3CWH9_9EIME|nr:hypothetical protein cyc_08511 [Cyclospora cayetanensis]
MRGLRTAAGSRKGAPSGNDAFLPFADGAAARHGDGGGRRSEASSLISEEAEEAEGGDAAPASSSLGPEEEQQHQWLYTTPESRVLTKQPLRQAAAAEGETEELLLTVSDCLESFRLHQGTMRPERYLAAKPQMCVQLADWIAAADGFERPLQQQQQLPEGKGVAKSWQEKAASQTSQQEERVDPSFLRSRGDQQQLQLRQATRLCQLPSSVLASACEVAAKMPASQRVLLQALVPHILQRLPALSAKELSLVAFAAAKVGGPGNNLAALVLEQLLKLLESHPEKLRELLSLSGLLRCIWAGATSKAALDPLMRHAEGVLLAAAKTLDARQTATLLWAVNRCMHHPGRRKAWPPSGRSISATGVSETWTAPVRLLEALHDRSRETFHAMSNQGEQREEVSKGQLRSYYGTVRGHRGRCGVSRNTGGRKGGGSVVGCKGSSGHALWQKVRRNEQSDGYSRLCNSLLALAAMLGRSEKRHTLFFLEGKMQQHIARRLVGFQPEDLAALASTLALTRGGAPLLQQRLLHVAAEAADTFNATQLSQIVYAFGLLRGSAHLFASLQFPVLERLQQFSVPELCDVVWSFAVARFHEPTFWEPCLSLLPLDRLPGDDRCALLYPALDEIIGALPALKSSRLSRMKAYTREAFWALQLEEHPSNFAESVGEDADGHLIDVLVQLANSESYSPCANPEKKSSCDEGPLSAQVALLCHADAQLQEALNGKAADTPLGPSVLKHRHLKRKGKFSYLLQPGRMPHRQLAVPRARACREETERKPLPSTAARGCSRQPGHRYQGLAYALERLSVDILEESAKELMLSRMRGFYVSLLSLRRLQGTGVLASLGELRPAVCCPVGFAVVHLAWSVWQRLPPKGQLELLQREIGRAAATTKSPPRSNEGK